MTTITYKGFSIEQERDGSYSIFRFGYVAGHFKTIERAKQEINWRRDIQNF